jgi:hypothetical protein
MKTPTARIHDVAAVVARLAARRAAEEDCPMFPDTGGGGGDADRGGGRGGMGPAAPVVKAPGPSDRDGFIRLVGALRTAQRKYFRTRSTADLDEAKRLEAAVDKWLKGDDARPRLPFGGE